MGKDLPEELQTSILLKLPIKALLRCTSVCKTWYTLITSPYFITTHLNFKNNNTPLLLLRYYIRHEKEKYSLYYDNEALDLYTVFESPFKPTKCFIVIGSCNGLICLIDDYAFDMDKKIIIWNPSVKKAVYLPKPIATYGSRRLYEHSLGFGFDSDTNDYKVVRVTRDELHVFNPIVEVYRLSTRIWEDISHLALPYYIRCRSIATYVNGAAHWIAWSKSPKYMIVLFDMHDEVFREMMLPSSLVISDEETLWDQSRLFDCQGSLCLLHIFPDERDDWSFEIWLMKEYGAADSWTKRFTVDVTSLQQHPDGFRNNYEMLCAIFGLKKNSEILWATEKGFLISYNPQTKEIKDPGISGIERNLPSFCFYLGTYTESLVLLDRRPNRCEADDRCSNDCPEP